MDKLETLSNYSGSISNVSSISGFGAYQDEFLELRHSNNPEKYPLNAEQRCTTPKQTASFVTYEERIRDLTLQLQNTLRLNEKYKNDLYNLEKKTELSFHDKIDKLIRHNKHLETQLETANNQIESLIKNYSVKDENIKCSLLESKIIKLEKDNHVLNVQNSLSQSDVMYWRDQFNELELINEKLSIESNDIKINVATREACVKELKEKISLQHLEIQNVVQNNNKLENQIKSLQIDLLHSKKSQDWYKEQLHLCQTLKQHLIDEVTEHKKVIISQNTDLEKCKNEINKWRNKYENVELNSIKERENVLKKLEVIEQQIIHSKKSNSTENLNLLEPNIDITNSYEIKIKELTEEVAMIKTDITEQQKHLVKVTKENSELIAKCISLQNITQQYESRINLQENTTKQLNMELKLCSETLQHKNKELSDLKEINSKLHVDLTARNQEKELVEISISNLREKFNIFIKNYENLKEELHSRDKQNLQLQKEKQQLFMNNNWQICELENSKEKDLILQNKIKTLEKEKQDLLSNQKICVLELNNKIENLLQEIQQNNQNQKSFENKIKEHTKEIEIYENTILRYKGDISEFQNEVNNLRILLTEREENLSTVQININNMNEKIQRRDQEILHMKTEYLNLERMFNTKLEIHLKEKQSILQENQTLKDNLASFVSNNYSKHDINQLEDKHMHKLIDYVYTACKKGGQNALKITDNNSELGVIDIDTQSIKILLNKLELFVECNNNKYINSSEILQEKDKVIEKLNLDVKRLKKDILNRLNILENRCSILKDTTGKSNETLESIKKLVLESGTFIKIPQQEANDQLNHFKALLTAKENEQREIRKRYEVNNRTLLRKVKEHMKGRNTAEKHNQYLQELYNHLSEEHNSTKLQMSSNEYEIITLKDLNEQYTSIIAKLKQSVSTLEKESSKSQVCGKCIEFEAVKNKFDNMQTCLNITESNFNLLKDELRKKDEEFSNVKNELQNNVSNYLKIVNENKAILKNLDVITMEKQELAKKIENLNCLLDDNIEQNRTLSVEILKYKDYNIEFTEENKRLYGEIEELNNKNTYLTDEIINLSCSLQEKTEELKQLESDKAQIMSSYYKKEQDSINLVGELKIQLTKVLNELSEIKSEKFFLQRLCNDLKIALQTNINHNKMLKEQISNLSQDSSDYSSLPNSLPNLSNLTKYDDGYITNLLNQNKAPLNERPLSDIQSCLDSLKSEIYNLQQQVVQKNVPNI